MRKKLQDKMFELSYLIELFISLLVGLAVVIMTVAGIAGAILGTLLAGAVPEAWLRKIFGIMLISAGIIALRAAMAGRNNGRSEEYSKNISTKEGSEQNKTTERDVKSDK